MHTHARKPINVATGFYSTIRHVRPQTIHTVARQLVGRRGIANMAVATKRVHTIPMTIRNTGVVRPYLRPLDNGHIRSVAYFQRGKNWASNQRWEMARLNRAAGTGRKPAGYWQRNARLINYHTAGTLTRAGLITAARGAGMAAIVELPIAAIEETAAVKRRRKTARQATGDGAKKVGVAAVAGGIGAGVAFGLVAAGAGSVLVPIAPVAAAIGVAAIAKRLIDVANDSGQVRGLLRAKKVIAITRSPNKKRDSRCVNFSQVIPHRHRSRKKKRNSGINPSV